MERRCCNRKSVIVSVYLSDGDSRLARCTATDISANGIFLKTNPLFVPRHKCLKLMFALRVSSSNLVRLRRVTGPAGEYRQIWLQCVGDGEVCYFNSLRELTAYLQQDNGAREEGPSPFATGEG